jgi:hypothetical protein
LAEQLDGELLAQRVELPFVHVERRERDRAVRPVRDRQARSACIVGVDRHRLAAPFDADQPALGRPIDDDFSEHGPGGDLFRALRGQRGRQRERIRLRERGCGREGGSTCREEG